MEKNIKIAIKKRINFTIINLITFFFINCTGGAFIGKAFYYPPGTDYKTKNYSYEGIVTFSYPFTKLIKKDIIVWIHSKEDEELLYDKFRICGGNLETQGVWNDFDTIFITLTDIGSNEITNRCKNALYNTSIGDTIIVMYCYDHEKNRFKRGNINYKDLIKPSSEEILK